MKKASLLLVTIAFLFLLMGCPPVDKPPKLTIPDKTVDEGQVLQFDLKQYAEDKDKNTLVFTIVSGVGEIVGSDYRYAPTFDNSGEKEVKIGVTNAKGKSAEDTFKITVNDVNRPPVLDIPDQTIDEGESLTLNLNDYADDPDGNDLTFSLVSGVGEINDATYTYTPDYDVLKKVREYNQAAESVDFEVSISVNDGKGGEATATFTIRVTDVNRPPVLDIPDQMIDEGEILTLNLLDYTTDPDALDTFTYTLISGVGNIEGSTYTYTATYTDAGTKTVTVRVMDNKGGTDESIFKITVNDVNRPPALDIPDQAVDEGETLTLDLNDYSDDPVADQFRIAATGVTRFGLAQGAIKGAFFPLPPLGEQRAIIAHINEKCAEISQAISRAEREIELMREYRTRLISDVVTGQVDVRGIEVPDVAEDELLAMEEDTADADDVIDDEGEMDETD